MTSSGSETIVDDFFFEELTKNRRFYAARCATCKKNRFPAATTCPDCGQPAEGWVQVDPEGVLESYCVSSGRIIGLIRLDKADDAFLHVIEVADYRQLSAGMRVEAVFSDARGDGILALRGFKPQEHSSGA
ncbi:MAG: hypothetical protein AABZ44_05720 [Elusimicrobiota bacterium]